MTKKKKLLLIIIPIVLILLVIFSGSRTNPGIERQVNWDSPQTKALFYRACADCHSHETKWPWYSYVAPVSWVIIRHVNHGREEFNISGKKLGEVHEVPEEISKGKMPLSKYLILHPEAKLTPEEKESLIAGLKKTFDIKDEKKGHDDKHEHDDDDDD
ncbi:MAG: heme-binding domain-containing protein [bacterium]|nr:heme-binding domain-containing protein [bacterium]